MKMGKNKRKTVRYRYKKWGSRVLSLSHLLQIGSFKKRINDLSINNNLLTSALQESLAEAAKQNSLLKSYAKDSNHILFARIKLNEMARNLAKFATDLEEVRNYLDVSLPADYNFFQKKRSSHETISKVPDVSCIEEESRLPENEIDGCENSPNILQSSLEENSAPLQHDVEMTPILFVNDAQDLQKKSSNVAFKGSLTPQDLQKKSSNVAYKGSLTPQLHIDLPPVKPKRSTRSRRKTPSFGKKSSTSVGSVVDIKSVSPVLMHKVEDPEETNRIVLRSSVDVNGTENESENIKRPPRNHDDKPIFDGCNDCFKIQPFERNEDVCLLQPVNAENNLDLATNIENNSDLAAKFGNNSDLEANIENNSGLAADFENNSEIHFSDQESNNKDVNGEIFSERVSQKLSHIDQSNSLFPTHIEDNSEIESEEKNENCIHDEVFSEVDFENLPDISQNTSLLISQIHDCDDEIQRVGSLTFCESDEEDDKDVKKSTISPNVRTSRSKMPLKYTDYFLSDEDSPFKLAVAKRSGSRKVKLRSTSNGKSCQKTPSKIIDEIPSEDDIHETDYSVYNLDVSNSKRVGKRSQRKPSAKSKDKKIKDLPVPLFKKSSVIKLKGGKLKFSKCENSATLKSFNKYAEKSFPNLCSSPGGILKKVQSSSVRISEDEKYETPLKQAGNIDNVQDNKRQSVFQTPKRVSFAPTDLVCKFEKMSESKKIAENKKVRRTSKSAIDLKELFEEEDLIKVSPTNISDTCESTVGQESNNSVLFNFSAETEMYAVTCPLNTQIPTLPAGTDTSPLPSASTISVQAKLDKSIEKSPESLNSPENTENSPLKESDILHNAVLEYSLEKSEMKAAILFTESPVSFLKLPKRKSLFKESSCVDLKENITEEDSVTEDELKNKTSTNNTSQTPVIVSKKSSDSKSQSKVRLKTSSKKSKKSSSENKSLEQLSILKDSTNVLGDNHSRRRSKQVCYKEPSLHKKLRRE